MLTVQVQVYTGTSTTTEVAQSMPTEQSSTTTMSVGGTNVPLSSSLAVDGVLQQNLAASGACAMSTGTEPWW